MHSERKPDVCGLATARDDFHRARFGASARGLRILLEAELETPDSALLAARVELRRGNPEEALRLLAQHQRSVRSRRSKAESAMLRAVAFARLGDPDSAESYFDRAATLLQDGEDLHAELTYQRAAARWIERNLGAAETALDRLPHALPYDLEVQSGILRGAIASAGENLPAQGATLLQTLRRVRERGDPGTYLHAMLVAQIAALAVELPGTELRDESRAEIARVHWTEDIGDLHFHALRAVAWRHALEGDEFNAFRQLKEALAVTRSPAWRVAALTDRAYLAGALGEQRWAAQELRDAHELAGAIDWNSIAGEEKLALPVLAELFAARDPSVAIHYAAIFKSAGKSFPRVLSSHRDRRVEALESYSLGRVQAELGDLDEARRLLQRAWEIYERLGIQWRAARAASALAELGDEQPWRARAEEALRPYPRNWLRRARFGGVETGIAAAASPQLERLTPAQRAVFDLLMDGRSTDAIASELGRSAFTIRNHVKAIFKVFHVSSRPALIVKASQGEERGLQG